MEEDPAHSGEQMTRNPYRMLALNLTVSLIIMYVAMFAMIYSAAEFIQNINFLYMALIMWAPMAVVMLVTMKSMYRDARLNALLYAAFAITFVLSFAGIRAQALVGDQQFLRSMIPHHSGAVLMCSNAEIADPEIKQLCGNIIRSQTREIAQMKAIMKRL
jgi:CDP-diglyceride synthetase